MQNFLNKTPKNKLAAALDAAYFQVCPCRAW